MIEAGTVQNGLKLISSILAFMIGDWRSILPTPAAWRVTTTPSSTVSTRAAGMFTITIAVAEVAGIGAQAHDVDLELAQAHIGRHVHGRRAWRCSTAPVALRPWRAWKRRTPAST